MPFELTIPGIDVEPSPFPGRLYFRFNGEDVEACVGALLKQMAVGDEIVFRDERDGDNEGYFSIRRKSTLFETCSGGHGWSRKSGTVNSEEASTLVMDVVGYNRIEAWSGHATYLPATE